MATQTNVDISKWAMDNWSSFNWVNSGVLFLDKELQMTVYNALAAQLLDVVVNIGETAPIKDCLTPEREEYQMLVGMVRQERELRNHIVMWAIEGRIRHVLIDSYKRIEQDGRVSGLYVIMKDIGNFTVLEQQMQRTDKLATVGKIAAGIAHEIRNPLTTVKGFLQMMENKFKAQSMDIEMQYTKVMLSELDRVNSLVSELLLLSKPHKVEKRPCSITKLLSELNPLIESQTLLRGIDYQCSIACVPDVIADGALIKQVVLNLVKNAVEAMEQGGSLHLVVTRVGNSVQIDVSDTGPGIPYYQMDKIFDAFFTSKEKGTGLGLPICQRIMADHGGEIRVSSKGFGTTFSILLPIYEERESTTLMSKASQ